MAIRALRAFAFFMVAGIGLLGGTLMTASGAHAQTAFSADGVVHSTTGGFKFPDLTEQTSAAGSFGALNTRVGTGALEEDPTGQQNTAIGWNALQKNTTGPFNTAVGYLALSKNVGNQQNTAIGVQALQDNDGGDSNTAAGVQSLFKNTTGGSNTSIGVVTMFNNIDGSDNTAIGGSALQSNGSGSQNTAIGSTSLFSNTSGNFNIGLGYQAGVDLTDGDYNIAIGNRGIAGESGITRIGTAGTHVKTFVAGINGVTTDTGTGVSVLVDSAGQLGTIASSRRYKEDIADMAQVSGRLLALRPVTFRYKKHSAEGKQPIQYGLIAEEVAEQMPELVVYNENGQAETVKYQLLSVLLLNELKKQHDLNNEQQGQLARQETQLTELQRHSEEIKALKAQLAELQELRDTLAVLVSANSTLVDQSTPH